MGGAPVLVLGPSGSDREEAVAELERRGCEWLAPVSSAARACARSAAAAVALLLPSADLGALGEAAACEHVVVADVRGSSAPLRAWHDATAAAASAAAPAAHRPVPRVRVRFVAGVAAAAGCAAEAARAPDDSPPVTPAAPPSASPPPTLPAAKRPRKFASRTDWSRVRVRPVALLVWYDGAAYKGFASQAQGEITVEGKLMEAIEASGLQRALRPGESRWDAWSYSRCGRTDRGVSAAGQVLTLRLRSKHTHGEGLTAVGEVTPPPEADAQLGEGDFAPTAPRRTGECRAAIEAGAALVDSPAPESVVREAPPVGADELDYVSMLNARLPDDVRVLGWRAVPADFSARFSCGVREYRYYFDATGLDLEAMADAAQRLRGEHDFRNFCKMDVLQVHNYRREIFECAVECTAAPSDVQGHDAASALGGDFGSARSHYILVRGSAFLWHQVRCIAAVLLMVGRGVESPGVVDQLLAAERKPMYEPAPEHPLVLTLCGFADPHTAEGSDTGLSFWCTATARHKLRAHFKALEARLQTRRCVLRTAWLHGALGDPEAPTPPLKGQPKHAKLMERGKEATYDERRERYAALGKC